MREEKQVLPIQPCGEVPSEYSVPEAVNTGALADLLARVEKAEGPDRELDCWLFCYMPGEALPPLPGAPVTDYGVTEWPPVTASLDMALALVERTLPEWRPHIKNIGVTGKEWQASLWWWEKRHHGWGRTGPLSILAAMLKALIARGDGE